nr:hypothetical protein [Pseudoalteromonas sp.]
MFVREAKRLCQKEFIKWFKLAMDVNPLMQYFKEKDIDIPILYIMGKEDHMFLGPVKEMVKRLKTAYCKLFTIVAMSVMWNVLTYSISTRLLLLPSKIVKGCRF